jgi:hypothetical protein
MTATKSPIRQLIEVWTLKIVKMERKKPSRDESQEMKDDFTSAFLLPKASLTTFDPELAEIENLEKRLKRL